MFLFYKEQNELIFNIYKPASSITEVLTTIGLYVSNNFNYSLIILLIILQIMVLKISF